MARENQSINYENEMHVEDYEQEANFVGVEAVYDNIGTENANLLNSRPELPYNQAVSSIRMAITSVNYPDEELTPEQCKQIYQALIIELMKCPQGSGPQFTDAKTESGIFIVYCYNKAAKSWLEKKIPQLKPWEAAKLKVTKLENLVKMFKVTFQVPTEQMWNMKVSEIIQLLKNQNHGLHTEKWIIKATRNYEKIVTVTVMMDESALKELSDRGFKAFFGLLQLTFRLNQNESEANNTEATSST